MKVLAIDGGGIRGLIPALVLAEVERRTGRRIAAMADLIAGTSTGAIIACALAKPDPMGADRIADIYVQDGPKIFHRSLLKIITSADGYIDERYDASGLVTSLRTHLGDARLSQATTGILIVTYDLQARTPVLFRRSDDVSMVDAAHASSAAPTYFEPVRLGQRTLVDGGVCAINPAMLAYAEAHAELEVLGSLGTGEHTRPIPFDDARGWGQIQWARPIIDVVFDGSADVVNGGLSRLIDDRYIRLQTQLNQASDALDDASEGNLRALRAEAERLIAANGPAIDRLCAALTA